MFVELGGDRAEAVVVFQQTLGERRRSYKDWGKLVDSRMHLLNDPKIQNRNQSLPEERKCITTSVKALFQPMRHSKKA